MSQATTLKQIIKNNTQILDIVSTEDLLNAWQKTTGKGISQALGERVRQSANYASAMIDTQTALKMIKDLGMAGKVITKSVNGKQYIIFKGYAGNRSLFTATRYLANNPKVVDMAIGKIGVNKSILSGARLTIFLVVPLNILSHILNDKQSMFQLIGSTAIDLIKVGVASAVGIATALTLDMLDKKFGVTQALVKALDEAYDSTVGEFGRQMYQVERRLKWQIMNGLPVGEGVFY